MKAMFVTVVLFFCLAFAGPLLASDSFRCGYEIVTRGETTVEAILACGQPSYTEILNPGFRGPRVENWFYNCGSGSFIQVLRFVEGRLQDVKNAGYGRGESECVGAVHR
jgi:hypothetical protein